MSKKTNPTAAAMRAARRVCLCLDRNEDSWSDDIAAVIDTETGLPEAIEALKQAESDFDALLYRGDLCDENGPYPRAIKTREAIRQALAKLEGKRTFKILNFPEAGG